MLDFPNSPTPGQKFPSPAIGGVPVYTWDGAKWTTVGGAVGGKTAVYTDGSTPMAAALTLVAPPVNPNDAAAKSYVDPCVRTDVAQASLTTAQQTQGRSNINAASFAALAYNNIMVNGAMEVSQVNGASGVSLINANLYIVDCWIVLVQSSFLSVVGVQNPVSPSGFAAALQVYVTAPETATPAAADCCIIYQNIEGYRIAHLGFGTASASPITLSFWAFAARPGTYSGAITNANNRAYAFSFTINAGSTFQYFTVTIPGDTAGAWVITNALGMQIIFAMMLGNNHVTAPGVWTAGSFYGATGTINGAASTSPTDTMLITGVTLLAGTAGPSAANSALAMRPYPEELRLCYRYYEKIGMTMANGQGTYNNTSWYKATKRASPTITLIGGALNGATVSAIVYSPFDGIRQTSNPTAAVDAVFSIDARL